MTDPVRAAPQRDFGDFTCCHTLRNFGLQPRGIAPVALIAPETLRLPVLLAVVVRQRVPQ
jgi:hypothetical protein